MKFKTHELNTNNTNRNSVIKGNLISSMPFFLKNLKTTRDKNLMKLRHCHLSQYLVKGISNSFKIKFAKERHPWLKIYRRSGVVVHTIHLGTQEDRGCAVLTLWVQGQPNLQREFQDRPGYTKTLSKKQQQKFYQGQFSNKAFIEKWKAPATILTEEH